MSTSGSSGADQVRAMLSGAGGAGPIEKVLDAVEDAAEQILAELAEVERLRKQVENLLHKLEEATESLGEQGEPLPAAPPRPAPAEPEDAGSETPRPTPRPTASEGAILLAAQMAVAGASRDQIEQRLRDDFGIEDPGSILGDDLS